MKPGDHVYAINPVEGMPFAGVVMDVADPSIKTWWIDMVMIGNHLPQMYKEEELKPLTADVASSLGMCAECLGYGTRRNYQDIPLASGNDQLPDPCENCGGTGRPAVRMHIDRKPNEIVGQLEFLPHKAIWLDSGLCLGCGIYKDSEEAKQLAHHIGEV